MLLYVAWYFGILTLTLRRYKYARKSLPFGWNCCDFLSFLLETLTQLNQPGQTCWPTYVKSELFLVIAPLIGVRVGSSEFLFRAGTAHYVTVCS